MTTHRTLIILLSVLKSLQSEDCVLNLAPREDAWDKKLHKDLRRNYYTSEPPNNGTCVAVSFKGVLRTVSLDEDKSVFTAVVEADLEWRDQRLTWSPAAYGGIEKIVSPSHQIWIPSVQVLNGIAVHNVYYQFNDCKVKYNGNISCSSDFTFKTFCSVNLRQWPYDMQRCAIKFGDDQFGVEKFSIFFFPFGLEKQNDWKLLLVLKGAVSPHNVSRHHTPDQFNVFIYRRGYGLSIIIVVPSIVIALLTLTSSFMNPKYFVRLGILCFSLLCHFVFLRAINSFLPKQSVNTPVILLFIRESTIVTIISILFTRLISVLMTQESNPFRLISLKVTKMFDSFGKYLIFPRWITNLTPDNTKNKEIWIFLASILNSIYIVILVITYVILYHKYMPGLFKRNAWKIF
ncbi:acetylcholine receptor subunit beta-like [Choristoneura fumiferana]|uniref:acetylcholine receptor subunit beta-like n=1 Tax=Choristoneura fumiferana TaxID=7141 RepID=UPI003D1553C5